MSNFQCKIKVKKTGEIKDAYAQDDYFGKHKYGYSDGDKTYKEEEVEILKEKTFLEKIEELAEYLWQASPHNRARIKKDVVIKILQIFLDEIMPIGIGGGCGDKLISKNEIQDRAVKIFEGVK